MEYYCFNCERSEKEVKLLDAIKENEIVKICEECAITGDIPIIRKPSSFQLKTEEKHITVYERLSRMAGIEKTPEIKERDKVKEIMEKITSANNNTEELSIRQRQELARKANKPLDLIDNFHWHIQMSRRNKKISQAQLASTLGEPESIIKMIEQGELPDDANRIIRKIEQFFGTKLAKSEFNAEQNRINAVRQPSRVLNFNQETLKTLTIADLIEMKKQQQAAEKQEKQENPKEEKIEKENQESDLIGSDIEFIED